MLHALLIAAIVTQPGIFSWDFEPQYVGPAKIYFWTGENMASARGPVAPTFATCGSFFGQKYTTIPGSVSYHSAPLLLCWDGSTDLFIFVFFSDEEGDTIADGETVIFDFEYRSIAAQPGVPGDSALDGNTVTVQPTYTQSGAGDNCLTLVAVATLDKDDADQAYDYGQSIVGALSINAASTYSGDPIVVSVVFGITYKQTCRAS